jgi:vitamin B12 transporter
MNFTTKKSIYSAALLLSAVSTVFSASAETNPVIEEVLVSASLTPIAQSRSANAVTVIDSEQLKNRAALTVSDLLRDVPGLAVSRSGVLGSNTQVRVRGAESNHLLVLVDGVEANDPSQGDEVNWGNMTAVDVERIEVIRGPQSAIHGSDAVAGVINIITRSGEKPFSASAFSETGSWSTTNNGLSLGHKGERVDLRLGVAHIQSEGGNISRTGDEKDGYRNTSVNLKAGVDVSEQLRVSFAARQTDGQNKYDADADFDGIVEDQDRASQFRNSTGRLLVEHSSVDGRWQNKVLVAQSNNDNENFSDGVLGTSTSSTKDQYQYVGSVFWQESAQRLSLLLEREEEELQQRGAVQWGVYDPNQDRQRNTDSVALEYRSDVTDSLTLAVSGRYDDNSEFDSAETYRLEASYQLSPETRLRSAWGTAVKNPTFTERFGYYTNFVGNPNLQPEESRSWEVGIDQELLNGDLRLGATLFDASLDNEIDGFVYDPVNFAYTSANKTGASQRQGVELTALSNLTETLTLNAAYTYTDSTESDAMGHYVDEVRRARHTGSATLAWQALDNLHININAQYNGAQNDVFFPPWPMPSEVVELDDYTLLNITTNYQATEQLELYLRLDNVLDDQYEEVFGYQALGFGGSFGVRVKL